MKDSSKTLLQHIIELRSVLINSGLFIIISMVVCYLFIDEIYGFIIQPLLVALKLADIKNKIIYTSITEVFTTHFRLAFYSSLFISFPYILNQVWKFIKSGLLENEFKIIRRLVIVVPLLFIIGSVTAFYVIIPEVFLALIQASSSAEFLPKMSENVSFIIIMMLSFGISFQMPVIIFLLDKLNILKAKTLQKLWREVILTIIVISAIITPPDAFSMMFLAVPLMILFFVSVVFCKFLK